MLMVPPLLNSGQAGIFLVPLDDEPLLRRLDDGRITRQLDDGRDQRARLDTRRQLAQLHDGYTTDPGKTMGQLWASAPGPRVSAAQAIRLGSQVLAGASINRAANTVTFGAASTHLVAVASLAGGPMRPSASPG